MRDEATFPTTDHQQSNSTSVRTLVSQRPETEIAPHSKNYHWLRWLALAAILIAGNLANALSWHFAIPIDTGVFSISLALGLYVAPGWSEWRRSRVVASGWRMRWRPTALALGAGLALAIPSVIFMVIASAKGGIGYTPIPSLPVSSLLVRELIEIPLLTAFVEELVFRQFIFRLFAQKSLLATVLVNAGIFTLWHVVVNARTVLATNFAASPLLDIGSYAGSMATIFAAGVVFALVRWRTGSFVYSALTHWLLLALITLAVWAL
jgi:membrane protease YdiL (CAAX protease family)